MDKTYRDGRRLVNDHQVVVEVDDAHGVPNDGSLVSARPFDTKSMRWCVIKVYKREPERERERAKIVG